MSSRVTISASPAPCDPAFDLLVDELIARLQAGEAPDWEALSRQYPEHVGRLRSMAQALEALGDLSRSGNSALSGIAPLSGAEECVPGVLGDFRLLREVGRGGMGVVYEAEQVSLNRRVALKVLPYAATMDPRHLERFRHEARAAALLHHPHIVPVHGVGCERGVHYYAMQLIEGCSLAAVIQGWQGEGTRDDGRGMRAEGRGMREEECTPSSFVPHPSSLCSETRALAARDTVPLRQAPKPFRRIVELVAQAADALEYAHTMGVVHRDVKPANLLLDSAGDVWVTDFGLARLGEGPGLTLSGDLLGTLRYMSPEQALARHGVVDHRTDVYSLGATLYELLTLRPAVDGASKNEILHQLAFEEPVPPRKLDRAVPAELETVTLKALAKNPAERYATAQELADDLRRWLDDRPTLARPPSLPQRLRKWSRRHRPLVIALGAFLALTAAGLGLGAVAYGIRQGELAEERTRLVQEKERSERKIAEDLRRVLAGRAEAVRIARQPGYRKRVWADLREAITLPASGADSLRATLLSCLGDPVGLDPIEDLVAVRRRPPELPSRSREWIRQAANGRPTAVSLDGRVAIAGVAGGVTVHNGEGALLQEQFCPLGGIYDLAFSADAKVLVAGCEQGFVAWDLAGSNRWVVEGGSITSVAISPNGRLLASGGRQLELWSLTTKRPVATLPTPLAGARVEFSADGRVLLAVANGTALVGWPVSDTPERRLLDGHTGGVPAVVFSPDGRWLVSISKDRTVRVWDAATGRLLRTLTGHRAAIEAAAFSPDGSLLATGDFSGAIRMWSAGSGDLLAEIRSGEPLPQVWRLQFGPAGEYLAAAGEDVVAWTVQVAGGRVTLERLCTLAIKPRCPGVIDLAARPGGSELIYLNREGRLYSYDLARADVSSVLGDARAAVRSLHFAPAGDRLTFVTTGGTLAVWDWQRKEAVDTHRKAETVAVSADGRWAALGGAEQNVTLADLVSGREILALPPEGSDVWCLAWAPDGTKLAVGLSDGGVAVWDLERVRARLADFGFEKGDASHFEYQKLGKEDARNEMRRNEMRPLFRTQTTRAEEVRPSSPVPAFDRVVRVNRLWAEAEQARCLANAAQHAGDYAGERDLLLAALELDKRLTETVPDVPGHRKRLAWTHASLARPLACLGNTKAALAHLESAAELFKRLTLEDPRNPDYRRYRAYELGMRGQVLEWAGLRAKAIDAARRAAALRKELAADPGTPTDHGQLVVAYHNLGFALLLAGQKAEAERWFNAALAAGDEMARDHPAQAEDPLFRSNRGATFHYMGVLRVQAGDKAGAVKRFREAVTLRARLADDFPRNVEYASDTGLALEWLGAGLRDLGQLEESAQRFREAVQRQRAALGLRPMDAGIRKLCLRYQANLASTLLRLGHHADAADAARELPSLTCGDPAVLLRAARLLAGCVALAQRNPGCPYPVGLVLARGYGAEAVALAQQAVAKGLVDITPLRSDSNFDPLRSRDEFRRLLEQLQSRKE
jgi:serine/threonine protein kinase/WD40 repeat protein